MSRQSAPSAYDGPNLEARHGQAKRRHAIRTARAAVMLPFPSVKINAPCVEDKASIHDLPAKRQEIPERAITRKKETLDMLGGNL